jgi:hypothetical protein
MIEPGNLRVEDLRVMLATNIGESEQGETQKGHCRP